jgi:DNA-binding transcriptional LysR family regulator
MMVQQRQPLADQPAAKSPKASKSKKHAGLDRLPWDNLRLFLAVAEAGSFRSAATLAAVSINTIRTKVDWLERRIGGPLLRRSVEGVALTQDGRELVQIAREMRELGRATARIVRGTKDCAIVRIVTTDGLGSDWLVRQLAAQNAADPALRLSLLCQAEAPDVLFRDTDLAVQLGLPTDPALLADRVGSLHAVPFASGGYIKRYGRPRSVADAREHHLVWLANDPLKADLLAAFPDSGENSDIVSFETNSATAHYQAVAHGAGIGFLPTYFKLVDPALVAIDVGVGLRRDIYIVRHEASVGKPAIDKAVQWLKAAFDPVRFPCFADSFVDPQQFDTDGDGIIAALPRRTT